MHSTTIQSHNARKNRTMPESSFEDDMPAPVDEAYQAAARAVLGRGISYDDPEFEDLVNADLSHIQ